jgi:hypothetical protein
MTCNLCHPKCHCGAEEAMRLTELERAPAAVALDAALLAFAASTHEAPGFHRDPPGPAKEEA